ncbi:MAG: tRNA preQ1(34) S-adenosylmethionine ribosyltransferase-isomerase QueA [Candidatus Helarchaeales archaeon]
MIERFTYDLPRDFIAQKPLEKRDESNLLAWKDGRMSFLKFHQIVKFFEPGDVLVLNNSRVAPCLLKGRKMTGGAIRLLVLKRQDEKNWECLVLGKKIRPGVRFLIEDEDISGILERRVFEGRFIVRFSDDVDVMKLMHQHGTVPLPEYIKEVDPDFDFERYQTCFAKEEGSIAAPTAGLHFTEELLNQIKKIGVDVLFITLHVGIGTILRIKTDDLTRHKMPPEFIRVTPQVASIVNERRNQGSRVFVVGTTTLKALENSAGNDGLVHPFEGESDLFIHPEYQFKFIPDAFITNFHLPKSSPLLMTAALVGWERLLRMYEEAKKRNFRFYSFGDAMIYFSG